MYVYAYIYIYTYIYIYIHTNIYIYTYIYIHEVNSNHLSILLGWHYNIMKYRICNQASRPHLNGHFRNRWIGGTYHLFKAYVSGLCKGIYPQNIAKHMVYSRTSILGSWNSHWSCSGSATSSNSASSPRWHFFSTRSISLLFCLFCWHGVITQGIFTQYGQGGFQVGNHIKQPMILIGAIILTH